MHTHHAHSGQFCKHAVGTLEEVLQTAIAKGFKVFGLSEHVPRYRRADLYPEEVSELLFLSRLGDLREANHRIPDPKFRLDIQPSKSKNYLSRNFHRRSMTMSSKHIVFVL